MGASDGPREGEPWAPLPREACGPPPWPAPLCRAGCLPGRGEPKSPSGEDEFAGNAGRLFLCRVSATWLGEGQTPRQRGGGCARAFLGPLQGAWARLPQWPPQEAILCSQRRTSPGGGRTGSRGRVPKDMLQASSATPSCARHRPRECWRARRWAAQGCRGRQAVAAEAGRTVAPRLRAVASHPGHPMTLQGVF